MLPWDPSGKIGPKRPLPDHVSILDPKDQPAPEQPYSEQKGAKPTDPAQAAMWEIITFVHTSLLSFTTVVVYIHEMDVGFRGEAVRNLAKIVIFLGRQFFEGRSTQISNTVL